MAESISAPDLIELTANIVTAHVSNNSVEVREIPALIASIHGALLGLGASTAPESKQEPAVSIRASVKPDYIVCLEDGKKLKMLKRHLMTRYGMTFEDYRRKWNLPADYPAVAPNYAERRRELAHKIGLGRKSTTAKAVATPVKAAKTAKAPVKRAKKAVAAE